MIQAFERRVVTYVPSAPPGFQVQMSNIGQHYYDWRYGGAPPPAATATATAPPAATATATATTPPAATATPTATPLPAHTAAQFVGTWINVDTSAGSVGKLWINQSGSDLRVHWFGVCSPGFCDNDEDSAAYAGEPFNITLGGRSFSLRFVDAGATQLQVTYQGTPLIFHRTTAAMYVGTWLNDDASTGSVAKLWIKQSGAGLQVQWFGACGGSLCANETKTVAYHNEPLTLTLDGHTFSIDINNLAVNRLRVIRDGSATNRMHKVQASDYTGVWTNVDSGTNDIVRMEISATGNTLHVHWFGACAPTPCDNGTWNATYSGEPLVVNAGSRTFTLTFDNAGATHLKVVVTGAPGGTRTDVMKR